MKGLCRCCNLSSDTKLLLKFKTNPRGFFFFFASDKVEQKQQISILNWSWLGPQHLKKTVLIALSKTAWECVGMLVLLKKRSKIIQWALLYWILDIRLRSLDTVMPRVSEREASRAPDWQTKGSVAAQPELCHFPSALMAPQLWAEDSGVAQLV